MDAACPLSVCPDTLAALSNYLRTAGSGLSLSDAATLAIRHWLAAKAAGMEGNGYQWKELFLPEGSELRMHCDDEVHHARVSGDAIVYQGRPVSPRQFTLAIAGEGRNAWRDLSVRLPGAKQFQPAMLLRRNAQAQIKARVEAEAGGEKRAHRGSPADAIAAAAQAMSEALRTALALVEHSNAQALPKYERRTDFHRRAADLMVDHARYD